jgi:rhodanese-related sulfurtransferase
MIRFISARAISDKLQLGEKPVLLDVTPEISYQKLHPRSAINIPIERLRDPRSSRTYITNPAKEIVIFAESHETEPAWEAAELLHAQGYNNLYIYEGGKAKWVEDGLSFQSVHYPPPPQEPPSTPVPAPVPLTSSHLPDETPAKRERKSRTRKDSAA